MVKYRHVLSFIVLFAYKNFLKPVLTSITRPKNVKANKIDKKITAYSNNKTSYCFTTKYSKTVENGTQNVAIAKI